LSPVKLSFSPIVKTICSAPSRHLHMLSMSLSGPGNIETRAFEDSVGKSSASFEADRIYIRIFTSWCCSSRFNTSRPVFPVAPRRATVIPIATTGYRAWPDLQARRETGLTIEQETVNIFYDVFRPVKA